MHDTTIVYMSHNDSIWINGEEISVTLQSKKVLMIEGCKFKIQRPQERVTKYVNNNLGLVVRVRRHMYYTKYIAVVRVKIGKDYCCSSPPIGGICGGCKDCDGAAFSMPCGMDATTTTMTTKSVTTPTTTTTDHITMTTETSTNGTTTTSTLQTTTTGLNGGWVTPDFDISLIPTGESTVETEGIDTTLVGGIGPGNTVCNDDASMITEKVQIFNSYYVSIEFFVKTCHAEKCLGTILSYTNEKTFAIKNYYGKIVITYGDLIKELDLMLENEKWSQVATVYDGNNYLDVYVFDTTGSYTRELVELDGTNPFSGKGRLALGKWQPPPDGSGDQPLNEGFEGCIDELRIWEKYVFFLYYSSFERLIVISIIVAVLIRLIRVIALLI